MSDRDRLADWLLSTEGRVARIVVGTAVILLGLALVGGFLGVLLLLIGAVEPDEGARKEPDEEWSAPLLARAERPPGQGPRTRDLRADEPAADEPADDSQG